MCPKETGAKAVVVDPRELRRAEARRRKVMAELGGDQREILKHIRIGKALDQMRGILLDEKFSKIVHESGLQTMPALLAPNQSAMVEVLDRSLDFLIAWRFFSPWLYDPMTAGLLDIRWPGFALELRDIFISIVADGPFPHERRGRDRRTM